MPTKLLTYARKIELAKQKQAIKEELARLKQVRKEEIARQKQERDRLIARERHHKQMIRANKEKVRKEILADRELKEIHADRCSKEARESIVQIEKILRSSLENNSNVKINMSSNRQTIIKTVRSILDKSSYPIKYLKDFDIDYIESTRILVIEYRLPIPNDLPKIKDIRYFRSKDELREVSFSEREASHIYDSLICQITLRTINEIYTADPVGIIESIFFNGWVTSIDKGHGNDITACIVSINVCSAEFRTINLSKVDPKACFKLLKGISASQFYSLTPIAPILQIDRTDKRFISSVSVTQNIDDATNIAAMSWEDFEYLIRELFEKEFKQHGGECKVTRASRDGGVDAIAFDPDPIRGGKIVIQAKRYTKTVGVSAVRDLYGTVLNEGANKGILVTTADYGPDSYEFAKGKPITLLNGANLLHLLESHGHKAIIDLNAARLAQS